MALPFAVSVSLQAKKLGAPNMIPINMLREGEDFLFPKAQMLFGSNVAYEMWPRGAPVPPKLVSEIAKLVEGVSSGGAEC